MDLVMRRVRLWPRLPDERLVDVVIRAGRIDEISDTDVHRVVLPTVESVDGAGGILVPAFADVHAHLDSTRLGLPFRPRTAEPGASRGGRSVFDGAPWSTANIIDDNRTGLAVGAAADLVILPAGTVTAAVMDHPPRTAVIHDGRVVARNGAISERA
jgi:cytosine/adenosine deaminase-related metal-dependent hydrolase